MTKFKTKHFKRFDNRGFENYALLEYVKALDGYRIMCFEEHGLQFYCAVYTTAIEATSELNHMGFELIHTIYE